MGSVTASVRIEDNLRTEEAMKKIKNASQRGLAIGGEYLLATANQTVPLLEGHLERSGRVKTEGDTCTVLYDIVYARYQHEGLDFVHTMPGRRAKWLELTLLEEKDKIIRIIGNEIRRELG